MKPIAIALALLGACKVRDPGADPEAALVQMTAFSDGMCACKDRACADKVQDEMNRWSAAMAKRAGGKADRIDPGLTKRFAEVAQRYGECMTKAVGAQPDPSAPEPPSDLPASADGDRTAEALIRIARDRAARWRKDLVLSRLDVSYVRADGTLDAKYGRLEVELHTGDPADDSDRPLGAPVPPARPITECIELDLEGTRWQQAKPGTCATGTLAAPRCSVAQVWARAIKDGAPANALAVVKLSTSQGDPPQTWTFEISDPPRKLEIDRAYPDDCEPVLEKK